MSSAVFIVLCVVLSNEDFLICIANTFTIYVFWKERRILQKASYLLINLAVADLFLRSLRIILLATEMQPYLFTYSELNERILSFHYSYVFSSTPILFSCSSVFSLAVISLERVYAVVWPLHHQTVSQNAFYTISC